MLTIEIRMDGRLIAGAKVKPGRTCSGEGSYEVEAVETEAPFYGLEKPFHSKFAIRYHDRFQSVFALVEKVARRAKERQQGEQN
jgi:hypothetical protein